MTNADPNVLKHIKTAVGAAEPEIKQTQIGLRQTIRNSCKIEGCEVGAV
jgi:hypothetical protein